MKFNQYHDEKVFTITPEFEAHMLALFLEASADANIYGHGWLRVGEDGSLSRINPQDILIAYKQGDAE